MVTVDLFIQIISKSVITDQKLQELSHPDGFLGFAPGAQQLETTEF